MLIKCKECSHEISDKAIACPYCGYPIREQKVKTSSKKRPRLPNGFGQISKIKDHRLRKPYRAMITVGKTPEGRPISKLLQPTAYFETYNEAYAALVKYNQNPYDLEKFITMQELYDKWTPEHFSKIKDPEHIKAAWQYCSMLYDLKVVDVRARHLKACINSGFRVYANGKHVFPSANIKLRMKSTFNLMLDYAVEYELVDRNYARTFKIDDDVVREYQAKSDAHMPFSDYEMQILWKNVNEVPYVDVLLMQCYSGWRPSELSELLLENVNLDDWTMKGGIKTYAGIDRLVPIHTKIRPIVKDLYDRATRLHSKYLVNCFDNYRHVGTCKMTYARYENRLRAILRDLSLNPNHKPHDGRKHFVSMAKKYNVDEYAIKYIVGHVITDLTESVYTQRDPGWLASEIEKIR